MREVLQGAERGHQWCGCCWEGPEQERRGEKGRGGFKEVRAFGLEGSPNYSAKNRL